MDFRLSNGPWSLFFKGLLGEVDVELYTNPESMVLVVIFDKEHAKVRGAVLELYKVFHAVGELHGFVETLPREVIVVTKHDERETTHFFILGSKPTYTAFNEEAFSKEIDSMVRGIKGSTSLLKDVSKAYDLELRELHTCPEAVKKAFFSQPLVPGFLASAVHGSERAPMVSFGELVLGVTRDGMPVKEPLSLFGSTVVSGGNKAEQLHALHLFVESALLSNVPAVVIDWGESFRGLSNKTSRVEGLREYRVEIEPIGFPVREFSVPGGVRVDLGVVDKAGLTEVIGLGDSVAGKAIEAALEGASAKGLNDVVRAVRAMPLGGNFNEFQRTRVVRVLRLLELRYPGIFDGPNDVAEVSKRWLGGIGRAGLIKMGGCDERVSLLVVHCLVRGLLKYYRAKGGSKRLRSLFVLPEAERVVPRAAGNRLTEALERDLLEMRDYGVGFVLASRNQIDLAGGLVERAGAKISIVRGNDVGVQLRGRKNYRVLLRPGLSECSELVGQG